MKTGRRDGLKDASVFVEWPDGLFTARGNWYHVTSDSLESFAAGVLEKVPLARMLSDADVWVGAAQTLALWTILVSLWTLSSLQAAALGVTVFVALSVVGPGLVTIVGVRTLRLLEPVWLQGAAYVAVLSLLANQGDMTAVGVGLVGFVLIRWGLLARAVHPIVAGMRRRLDPLPAPDRILRGLFVRQALSLGVSLPETDRMEARMLALLQKRPGSKRKN